MSPRLCFFISALILVLGIFANSGTLSGYAVSQTNSFFTDSCKYLVNSDHEHFVAPLRIFHGEPKDTYFFSVMIRRPLYPILLYIPTMIWKTLRAGVYLNILIHVLTLFALLKICRNRFSFNHQELWIPALLFVLYPGMYYWVGLPYAHALIAPLSILLMSLLFELEQRLTLKRTMGLACIFGIGFCGYDILPFFLLPALYLLYRQKKWGNTFTFLVFAILPLLITSLWIKSLGLDLIDSNTLTYKNIFKAYIENWNSLASWKAHLFPFFPILFTVFLFSNFATLPLTFLFALSYRPRAKWVPYSCALVLALGFAMFTFLNLAPDYPGWQMRGVWIPRIYQPLFAPLLFSLALFFKTEWKQKWIRYAFIVLCIVNSVAVFGPKLGYENLTAQLGHRFYRHSGPASYSENIALFGRRHLGQCSRNEDLPKDRLYRPGGTFN